MRSSVLALALALAAPATASAADPTDKPLQTPATREDRSYMLQGWTANITGIGGGGKTELLIEGDEGYVATIQVEGEAKSGPSPATFTLADKDHRIAVKVSEPRGATWEETVDVPKGMKVTVKVKARYEHIGYDGTIKNDTLGCTRKTDRKHYHFEIFQGGAQVGNPIDLEPGKSAPGVRLKVGSYELKISERGKADVRVEKLEVKEPGWRFDVTCPQ